MLLLTWITGRVERGAGARGERASPTPGILIFVEIFALIEMFGWMAHAKDRSVDGVPINPPNRFDRLVFEPDPEALEGESPRPRTEFLADASRSILARNQSPDVGFELSLNPYRGCEHGCTYCFARPTHETLGFSSGLDFETKILVKRDAPALLRKELSSQDGGSRG